MDLNYLYGRQQVELMRADRARCSSSRSSHRGLAALYGELINRKTAHTRSASTLLAAMAGGAQ